MKERLAELMRFLGINANQFAKKIGLSRQSVAFWLAGRNNPSYEMTEKIATTFGIDAIWLRTGRGAMLKDGDHLTPEITKSKREDISVNDLFNYNLILDKYLKLKKNLEIDPDENDCLRLVMPTDELAPVVPRGSIALLSIEENPSNPSTSEAAAVGIIKDGLTGNDNLAFGKLSIVRGRMYITPTNPAFGNNSTEVSKVVARVEGWIVRVR